jgi:ABC-type dipeptide/oligopeptide/nickel transport system permease component
MLRFILTRLLGLFAVMLVVSFITFAMLYRLPGGPFDQTQQPLSPIALANIRAKYNLDKPFYVVWASYIANAARGDFGTSYQAESKPIIEIFQEQWGTSLALGGLALAWSVPLGVLLGVFSATRRNTIFDYIARFVAIIGTTVPNFAMAVFLVYLFAVVLKMLPTGGWGLDDPRTLILPTIIFGLVPFGSLTRFTRNGMLETLSQDYVRTARAKGLFENVVVFKHALRNVLIPVITVIAPMIPNALTGSAILEKMFRINGIGKYFIDSIGTRDYPMVLATVLIVAVLWGISFLIADLLYTVVDPRLRINK